MNKTSKFFLGFASLSMLAACSSDEPAQETVTPGAGDGTTMYLAVNITDANSMGRALEDNTEGDFVFGTENEHEVSTANFFFFDANGIYLTQAEVWNGGKPGSPEGDNVEYLGNNVLILEGLTETNLPKYVVTILNTPADIVSGMVQGVTTMEQLRNTTVESYLNGNNFIMTTSSFFGGDQTLYDDDRYYANRIPQDYLLKEPIDINNPSKKLDIYVERLAVKYTMSLPEKNEFIINLTVAGEWNENNSDPAIGDTQLKVKISGFGVTTTEHTSFLSKNLDGFKGTDVWTGWNIKDFHRSFWGKSVNYDKTINAETFDHTMVYATLQNGQFAPVYSFENTNSVANITRTGTNPAEVDASRVTNFVFTAEVTNVDGSAITDLIKFGGLIYKNDQFKNYLLTRIKETSAKKLNYWKQVTNTTETIEGGIVVNGQTYVQVGNSDFDYKKMGNGGKMTVEFVYDGDVYSYDAAAADGSKFTKVEGAKAEIDEAINNIINIDNYPVRYNGGKTVYTIPVQHLLGVDNQYTITKLGEFGVVRNHWYEVAVRSISKLGQGVFNPGNGEDGDIVYPDPDPDPDTYGLVASIKLLSWKVVKQTVDL